MSSATQRPGFIGLGIAGAPMALYLIKAGQPLFVPRRSKVPARVAGATACASPTEPAERAGIVFTMRPDTPAVEAVLFGKDGMASGQSKGRVVVDMRSILPIETKASALQIKALTCSDLDAPASGADVGARA